MDWIRLIVVILSIILSQGISHLVFKDNKQRKQILFWILLLSLTVITSRFLIPQIEIQMEIRLVTKEKIKKELKKELHFCKAIKDNDPKIYNEMVNDIFKIMKSGKGKENGLLQVRKKFTNIIKERLIRASNETILNYLKTAISEIDDLQIKNSNICFDFVKKGYVNGVNTNKIFTKKTKKLKFKLIESILQTYNKDYKIPLESEVSSLTLPIYEKLFKSHGMAIFISLQQKDPNINQKKACNLIKDLFIEVSKLDKEDSAKVTRYIISSI